jgi:hypothetical protein
LIAIINYGSGSRMFEEEHPNVSVDVYETNEYGAEEVAVPRPSSPVGKDIERIF